VLPGTPHRRPIIGRLTDIRHAPRGTCDSACASHGSDIPALLTSPSGYARATGPTSTSAVAVSEGRIAGTSAQPSSDDHTDEVGLLAAGRQTHLVGHLVIAALSGAPLRSHCPG
jgi:hypothetical protein